MIKIGILGDIGSGKSYVAKNFGYPVFNADAEVGKLYKRDRKIFNKLKKALPKYFHSFPIEKKEVSNAIKNQMVDDESLIAEVDRGFDKNKSLMKSTMGKIDKVLTSASGNTMCYVFLFAIIVVALLWKLTK